MLQILLRRLVGLLAIDLAIAATLVAPSPSSVPVAQAAAQERVTLIGDSAATAILWYPEARSIFLNGRDLQLQVAVCRRLTGESCPFEGSVAPTLLQVAADRGRELGPTVIVVMGYNDFEQTFDRSVEESLAALRKAGVQRVVWATMRAARVPYLAMNDVLRNAVERHPELTVVDWDLYSRSHPDWFQNDGIHLFESGGVALATFLRAALRRLESMPPEIVSLPDQPPLARVGRQYVWRFGARGGVAPYRWSVDGLLPRGISLRDDGSIAGVPRNMGDARIVLRLVDRAGRVATRQAHLVVRRA